MKSLETKADDDNSKPDDSLRDGEEQHDRNRQDARDHQDDHDDNKRDVPIIIDEVEFLAPSHRMTGAELRNLPTPSVSPERDLWLEVHGKKDDELIRPEVTYSIKQGSVYYTAPSTINPGGM